MAKKNKKRASGETVTAGSLLEMMGSGEARVWMKEYAVFMGATLLAAAINGTLQFVREDVLEDV